MQILVISTIFIPCGIRGKAVTSLHVELGKTEISLDEVKSKILTHFKMLFEAEYITAPLWEN